MEEKSEKQGPPAIALTAEQLAAVIRVGLSHYSQGRWKNARVIFEGLCELDPQNPYLHALLGSVLQQEEKLEKAVEQYSRALELFPEDICSVANRGEIRLKQGRIQEAAADFARAISLDPEAKHPSANRARLLLSMTKDAVDAATKGGIAALKNIPK